VSQHVSRNLSLGFGLDEPVEMLQLAVTLRAKSTGSSKTKP
jgi:hypothetical protein